MALALIKGIGLGAGLMYFLDPDLGRRRRALVADQFTHAGHSLGGFLGASARDLGNRAWGLTAELGRRFRAEATPSDDALVERVRATLGHHVSRLHAIEVAARGGHVLLRGPIPASELEAAIQAAASVPGVLDVADELSIHHDEPDHSPHLERMQSEFRPQDVSPAARLVMGAAGVALALPIVRRAPLTGLALGGLGLILATRGTGSGGARAGRSAGAMGAMDPGRDSGRPGGGRGRIDETGRSGVYPASGPLPPGRAEVRTPVAFVRGQFDDQGRPVEGGSELTNWGGTLLSDTPQSGPPAGDRSADHS